MSETASRSPSMETEPELTVLLAKVRARQADEAGFINALVAVLTLHAANDSGACNHCWNCFGDEPVPYPCATTKAIADALAAEAIQ